jgi:hypothetical protein
MALRLANGAGQSQRRCFNCSQRGHQCRDCPEQQTYRACHRPGHEQRDCHNADAGAFVLRGPILVAAAVQDTLGAHVPPGDAAATNTLRETTYSAAALAAAVACTAPAVSSGSMAAPLPGDAAAMSQATAKACDDSTNALREAIYSAAALAAAVACPATTVGNAAATTCGGAVAHAPGTPIADRVFAPPTTASSVDRQSAMDAYIASSPPVDMAEVRRQARLLSGSGWKCADVPSHPPQGDTVVQAALPMPPTLAAGGSWADVVGCAPSHRAIFMPVPPPAPEAPTAAGTGLANATGENSCFLNASVQALYRIVPFRAALRAAVRFGLAMPIVHALLQVRRALIYLRRLLTRTVYRTAQVFDGLDRAASESQLRTQVCLRVYTTYVFFMLSAKKGCALRVLCLTSALTPPMFVATRPHGIRECGAQRARRARRGVRRPLRVGRDG